MFIPQFFSKNTKSKIQEISMQSDLICWSLWTNISVSIWLIQANFLGKKEQHPAILLLQIGRLCSNLKCCFFFFLVSTIPTKISGTKFQSLFRVKIFQASSHLLKVLPTENFYEWQLSSKIKRWDKLFFGIEQFLKQRTSSLFHSILMHQSRSNHKTRPLQEFLTQKFNIGNWLERY